MISRYKIAIIAVWFGKLPDFFPAWLRSAEMNPDIDFFLFSDGAVKSDSPNIHIIRTTMEKEMARATREIKEVVNIKDPYKFCDLRPFYGQIYQAYIADYDFWGYCDIDLVFGQLRSFLTDEVLANYDRFYTWGHLSVFRNNEKMTHLCDLPGGLYSREEILRSPVHVAADEHYGLNRICALHEISWYQNVDYADFWVCYSDLRLLHGQKNDTHQVFYWEDGRVWRAAVHQGEVIKNEYVYLHWQKRKPTMDADTLSQNAFFITSQKLLRKQKGTPSAEYIVQMCPAVDERVRRKEKRDYVKAKIMSFMRVSWKQKLIWIRQKWLYLRESGSLLQH